MFYELNNVISIDLSNFNTSKVKDMNHLFCNCTNLLSLDLSNLITSNVENMNNMFKNCEKLISLNLSNFDTSNVKDMNNMFRGCESLRILDISHFNTINVKKMNSMFTSCSDLTSLDLSSFDTLNVTKMNAMFDKCNNLISLDLSNFNTSNVDDMNYMFSNCYELVSLDISNFNTSKVINMNSMFKNCRKLVSLDLSNFNTSNLINISNIFDNCNKDLIFCININIKDGVKAELTNYTLNCSDKCYTNKNYKLYKEENVCVDNCYDLQLYEYNNICFNNSCPNNTKESNKNQYFCEKCIYYINSFGVINCIKNDKCPYNHKNLIKEKDKCINNCNNDNKYIYEYNDICYELCPKNTYSIFNNNKNLCIKECPIELPYENEMNECISECNITNLFNKKCFIKNDSPNIKDNIIKNIRNELLNGTLNELLINIDEGEDLIIRENNCIYHITTPNNQNNNEYEDISIIKLNECEKELRDHYKIDDDDTLLIFKIDYYEENLLIPIVEYEIYSSKTKKKLDLSVCNNIKINIFLPTYNVNENELFKYNLSSEYYNDICFIYTTINHTDITLYDRKNEYNNNNMSLCESNCTYKEYNKTTKKSKCECDIKINFFDIYEINFNKDKLINKFKDIKKIINLNVMKCYKLLFTKDIVSNIGNYILLSILLIIIINCVIFIFYGYKTLYAIIEHIIKIQKIKINNNNNNKIIKNKNKSKVSRNNIGKSIKNKAGVDKKEKNEDSKLKLTNNNKLKKMKKGKKKKKINKNIINTTKEIQYDNFGNNYNDFELNNLSYDEALKIDKRNYKDYYFSLLRRKQILIFAFYTNDYNSRNIKICLFFFSFSLSLTINALFFNDTTMHKIYVDEGEYNFIYQIPQILYSSIISVTINTTITFLSITEEQIAKIKKEEESNEKKIKLILKIKFIFFFVLTFLLLIFFWYYLSCFCAVYPNTQLYLMKDNIISYGLSITYPIFISLVPGIFRIYSLKASNKEKKCIYKLSKLIQSI